MKKIKVFTNLFAFALVVLSLSAQATPLTFNFTGIVTATDGSLSGVDVGSSFLGSFSYDPSVPANYDFGFMANYSYSGDSALTANIGGHTVTANNISATIFNNTGGNIEDGLMLDAYPPTVDGTTYNSGDFGIVLGSLPGHSGALPSTALPSYYNFAAFADAYGGLERDGGQTGTILEFTIQDLTSPGIAPVPEPQTYAMLIGGLCLISFSLRRHKKNQNWL